VPHKQTKKDQDYPVGYGKPPIDTQFKKGQSGNPAGRPKGQRNVATALQAALNERVTIVENGQRKSITKLEASMKQVVNRAAAGESVAIKLLLQLFPFLDTQIDDSGERSANPEADQQVLANIVKRMHQASIAPMPDQSPKKEIKK